MTNYEQINNLISSFSGQKNIISFPVVYLKITEDLNTALLLNQLVFWSDKSKRTDGFFYKTYGEWHEEIHLSEYQVRRSIKKLKELNIVETKLKKANGSPTLHYRVLMNNLSDLILKNVQNGILRNSRNESKVSSETLTDDYTDDYNIDNNTTQKERFEKIWVHYPLKKGKENAFKSYQKAIKDGAKDLDILNGIKRYNQELKLKGTKKEYIAYGSTWFSQRRWSDEYESDNNQQNQPTKLQKANEVNWDEIYGKNL